MTDRKPGGWFGSSVTQKHEAKGIDAFIKASGDYSWTLKRVIIVFLPLVIGLCVFLVIYLVCPPYSYWPVLSLVLVIPFSFLGALLTLFSHKDTSLKPTSASEKASLSDQASDHLDSSQS